MFKVTKNILFSLAVGALGSITALHATEELPHDFYRTCITELTANRNTITGQVAAEHHAADRAFLYTALMDKGFGKRYEEVQVLSGLPYTKPLLMIPEQDMPQVHRRLDALLPKLIAKSIYLAPTQSKIQAFMAQNELHLIFTKHQLETYDAETLTRQLAAAGVRPLLKAAVSRFFSQLRITRVADSPGLYSRMLAGAFFGFMLPVLGLVSPRARRLINRMGGYGRSTLYGTTAGAILLPLIGYLQHLKAVRGDEAALRKEVEKQLQDIDADNLSLSEIARGDANAQRSALHYNEQKAHQQEEILERLAAHYEAQGEEEPIMLIRRRAALAKQLAHIAAQKETLRANEQSSRKQLQEFLLKPYIRTLRKTTFLKPDVSTDEEFHHAY